MKGTYTLILACREPFRKRIGSLGYARISRGYYLYTGSALGAGAVSLGWRLRRHSRPSKKRQWHVDYLTSDPRCQIEAVVYLKSPRRLECTINRAIVRELKAQPVLLRAGASDCRCDAHLTKITSSSSVRLAKILSSATSVYRRFGDSVHCDRARSSVLLPIS